MSNTKVYLENCEPLANYYQLPEATFLSVDYFFVFSVPKDYSMPVAVGGIGGAHIIDESFLHGCFTGKGGDIRNIFILNVKYSPSVAEGINFRSVNGVEKKCEIFSV